MSLSKKSEARKQLKKLSYQQALAYAKQKPGEPFYKTYLQDREQFRLMMIGEIALEKKLRRHFKETADQVVDQIDWAKYNGKVMESQFGEDLVLIGEALLIAQLLEDTMKYAFDSGIDAAQKQIKVEAGWDFNSPEMIALYALYAKKQGAVITDGTQKIIDRVFRKGLKLGWEDEKMRSELRKALTNEKRIDAITGAETILAYQIAKRGFIKKNSKVGLAEKRWRSVLAINTCEWCRANHFKGWVPINHKYPTPGFGMVQNPLAHVHCKCDQEYRIKKI